METSLYLPVKRFLEGLGFEVKGEVCGCDVVAVDRGAPIALVICELKLSFTLDLVLQAVDRSTACDEVWVAVRASARGRGRESDPPGQETLSNARFRAAQRIQFRQSGRLGRAGCMADETQCKVPL